LGSSLKFYLIFFSSVFSFSEINKIILLGTSANINVPPKTSVAPNQCVAVNKFPNQNIEIKRDRNLRKVTTKN